LTLHHSQSDELQDIRLDEDTRQLGSYGVDDGMILKVADISSATSQFQDLSLVEKFELSPEEYEKRTGTLRAYKQQHKLGRFASPSPSSTSPPASADNFSLIDQRVGSRCQIRDGEGPQRRGTIRFVGRTRFGKQDDTTWVGIELDNPLGRNDGSVQGHQYFECLPQHGVFVHPANVDIGDYPPIPDREI